MCGRYTLTRDPRLLQRTFGIPDVPPALKPRYNIAPTQLVVVVGLKPDGLTRGMALLRWGFVPSWANDPNGGPRPINAKAESVALKPPFKHAFRERRCLVPADGFFEWVAENGRKVPHLFRLKSGEPFAFAGVWDRWGEPGLSSLLTCALITTAANDLVRPIHDRMPAILPPETWDRWLDTRTPVPELLGMLAPFPAELMDVVRVGQAVNRVANDSPECVTPAA
jgi:putative SOS response-associated peptidase YedK